MSILNSINFKCNVSSVLNKDIKQHGKKYMFDQKADTAWSTDQGSPQWIVIDFEHPQQISSFAYQFQGGFAGKHCVVRIENDLNECIYEENFYPDDVNSKQNFKLKNRVFNARKIKFRFESSTDFFGRIIVYSLEIFE